jgi:hypothetical protein
VARLGNETIENKNFICVEKNEAFQIKMEQIMNTADA